MLKQAQQAQAMQAAMAQQGAGMAKTLSDTQLSDNNALAQLSQRLQAAQPIQGAPQ